MAIVSASGFCALKAYQSYNRSNNALLLENIEAMSKSSTENSGCPNEKMKKCWMNTDSTKKTLGFICEGGRSGNSCPSKKEKVYLYSNSIVGAVIEANWERIYIRKNSITCCSSKLYNLK